MKRSASITLAAANPTQTLRGRWSVGPQAANQSGSGRMASVGTGVFAQALAPLR